MNRSSRGFRIALQRTIGRSFAVLLALVLFTSSVLAADPVNGTLVGADHTRGTNVEFLLNGQTQRDFAGVLLVDLTSPVQRRVGMFCIEATVATRAGTKYMDGDSITTLGPSGCAIRYLLSKYPALSITSPEQGAAVQLAIWHFTDGVDLSTITDANIRAQAQAFANEAANAPCPPIRSDTITLTLTPPTATVPAGQPQTYTLAGGTTAAGLSATITVSGPGQLGSGGTTGTVQFDGQGNATFSVVPTGPGQITISVTTSYTVDAGTIFNAVNTQRQKLVLGEAVPFQASVSATLEATQASTPTFTPVGGIGTATPTGTQVTQTATATTGTTSTPGNAPTPSTATPTRPAGETATPTSPGGNDQPTTTPTSPGGNDQPTATPTTPPNNDQPTATPTAPGNDQQPTATPGSPEGTATPEGGQPGDTPTPGGEQGVIPTDNAGAAGTPGGPDTAAAGGAATGTRQPGRLPTTGDANSNQTSGYIALLIAALMLVTGVILRRRGLAADRSRRSADNTRP